MYLDIVCMCLVVSMCLDVVCVCLDIVSVLDVVCLYLDIVCMYVAIVYYMYICIWILSVSVCLDAVHMYFKCYNLLCYYLALN